MTFDETVERVSDLMGHSVAVYLWASLDGRGINAAMVGRLTGGEGQRPAEDDPDASLIGHHYFFKVGADGSWFCVSSLTFESARFDTVNADDPEGLWIEHGDGSKIAIVAEALWSRELG